MSAAPSAGGRSGGGPRRPFFRRRKTCPFSGPNAPAIDYKDIKLLSRFISERGKIVPSRITAVSAITTLAALVTALHHGGWAGLQLIDAHGHEAQDVFADAHVPFHLGDRGCGSVEIEQDVMALAVLLDLVGEGLQTPLLGLGNFATVVANDRRVSFGELLDLRGRDVLACDEHAFIIRHLVSPWLLHGPALRSREMRDSAARA